MPSLIAVGLCHLRCECTLSILFADEIQWWSDVIAAAVLDKELYLLQQSSPRLDVCDAVSFRSLGSITVPGLAQSKFIVDMTACSFYRCLYFADGQNTSIIRLEVPSKYRQWTVEDMDIDSVISVTSSHDLLVLCGKSNKLKLFGTDGVLRSTIALEPLYVTCAVELTPRQYLVTHGRDSDPLHRVCIVNSEGRMLMAGLRDHIC